MHSSFAVRSKIQRDSIENDQDTHVQLQDEKSLLLFINGKDAFPFHLRHFQVAHDECLVPTFPSCSVYASTVWQHSDMINNMRGSTFSWQRFCCPRKGGKMLI